jgi:hypothetical protein
MVQQYVMFSSIRTLNFIILTINYQPDLHRRRLQFIYQFLRQQCEGHEDIPPAEDGAEDDIWRKMQIESLALFNSLKVMGATHEEIITDVNDEVKSAATQPSSSPKTATPSVEEVVEITIDLPFDLSDLKMLAENKSINWSQLESKLDALLGMLSLGQGSEAEWRLLTRQHNYALLHTLSLLEAHSTAHPSLSTGERGMGLLNTLDLLASLEPKESFQQILATSPVLLRSLSVTIMKAIKALVASPPVRVVRRERNALAGEADPNVEVKEEEAIEELSKNYSRPHPSS